MSLSLPLMTQNWEDNFEALLKWLGPDREIAGQKYEEIRHSLVTIFDLRGCHDSEDLADEVITRVSRKLPKLVNEYSGDPALYFYGVAKHLLFEVNRRKQKAENKLPEQIESVAPPEINEEDDAAYECLEQCLAQLPSADRELVLLYYQQDKTKISHRRELAARFGLAPNNLRVKVHRIRTTLHNCINKCLKSRTGNETNLHEKHD
jgi:RNA polymerase sigma factor (sigma-70 family)